MTRHTAQARADFKAGRRTPALASAAIRAMGTAVPIREVLFLCTGNYYRSRYAEALFNHEAARRGLAWRAVSRGLAIHLAPPAGLSPHTTRRLRERNIPAAQTGPDPVQVGEADLRRATQVVALKGTEHRPLLAMLHPDWVDRVEYWEINDLDGSAPEVALAAIEAHVGALLTELERRAGADSAN